MGTSNGLVTHIFKTLSYVPQKKETHTGLKQLEGEQMMTEITVDYPFNTKSQRRSNLIM